jgi:hypothetical protein
MDAWTPLCITTDLKCFCSMMQSRDLLNKGEPEYNKPDSNENAHSFFRVGIVMNSGTIGTEKRRNLLFKKN